MVIFLSACSVVPKMPSSFSLGGKNDPSASSIAASNAAKTIADKTLTVEQRLSQEKLKLEVEYAKFKAEMQKAYDDLKKKDIDNFIKIAELNYGVYLLTEENKNKDIDTAIVHLRAKEIMTRTDTLPEGEKAKIKLEVAEEKRKSVDELSAKYKTSIDLAIAEKSELDAAERLIIEKEKEKAVIKEANKNAMAKLEADKNAEILRVQKEAADQVRLLKEAQKEQLMRWLIYGMGGIGIIFIILGILLKNPSFIITGATFLGMAYAAASIPMWLIGVISLACIIGMVFKPLLLKKKELSK